MILEQETFEAFSYYPFDLSYGSSKLVLVVCDECGKVRLTAKNKYRALCMSCSQTGKKLSDETRRKIGEAQKGEKHPRWRGGPIKRICKVCGKRFYAKRYVVKKGEGNYCSCSCAQKDKKLTDETKRKLSNAQKGRTFTDEAKRNMSKAQKGDKNPAWKGGTKLANARHRARRRHFEFKPINASFESSEGHHIDMHHVLFIPQFIHQEVYHNMHTGQGMQEINALAIDFLLRGI